MKTSELSGALLDYWVAKAEDLEPYLCGDPLSGQSWWGIDDDCALGGRLWIGGPYTEDDFYSPSTDWAQGGPIMQLQRIGLEPIGDEWQARRPIWTPDTTQRGPEPLIAAMRTHVASVYGDTVPE